MANRRNETEKSAEEMASKAHRNWKWREEATYGYRKIIENNQISVAISHKGKKKASAKKEMREGSKWSIHDHRNGITIMTSSCDVKIISLRETWHIEISTQISKKIMARK